VNNVDPAAFGRVFVGTEDRAREPMTVRELKYRSGNG
jgi:hypothetical protein